MRAASVISGVVCVSALLARAPFERHAVADGPAPAEASRKLACIAADTDGQALRLKDELRAARSRFNACATEACPKIVREDCLERIAEVARAQPMIVFEATNGHGRTLRAVKVLVDEQALTEKLDGRPLAVDPGEHTFTFSALGRAGDNLHLTLSEGARERRAVVLRTLSETPEAIKPGPPLSEQFEEEPSPALSVPPAATRVPAPMAAAVAPAVPAPAAPFLDLDSGHGRVEAAALGVGTLGVVLGAVFGVLTISNWSAATNECKPGCSKVSTARADASDASTYGNVSTASFVIGGAVLAGGAVLWFTDRAASQARQGLRVIPSAGPNRGQLLLQSRF